MDDRDAPHIISEILLSEKAKILISDQVGISLSFQVEDEMMSESEEADLEGLLGEFGVQI
jgi:hypothetical protein